MKYMNKKKHLMSFNVVNSIKQSFQVYYMQKLHNNNVYTFILLCLCAFQQAIGYMRHGRRKIELYTCVEANRIGKIWTKK